MDQTNIKLVDPKNENNQTHIISLATEENVAETGGEWGKAVRQVAEDRRRNE